ncbi:hypothetical protein CERSUDRAFT_69656 [Gelatoporia subvermispora B]|uniref:Uncharacterized protein n=1 Tax=Ceriporiopsis subvermispora (strain B) TaxID=914234 RepID=M2QWT8_CERS8|nr:hypothetical protein CERSUDRAFT_69656 [Gelatoporia subvermispora B]
MASAYMRRREAIEAGGGRTGEMSGVHAVRGASEPHALRREEPGRDAAVAARRATPRQGVENRPTVTHPWTRPHPHPRCRSSPRVPHQSLRTHLGGGAEIRVGRSRRSHCSGARDGRRERVSGVSSSSPPWRLPGDAGDGPC